MPKIHPSVRDNPITQPRCRHPADRLLDAIERTRAPICVGLDPVIERLPAALQPAGGNHDHTVSASALAQFCAGVLDAVADIAPCVKIQAACFERYRAPGWVALETTLAAARQRGLEVILDAKRGDIGISASHYAASVFDGDRDGEAPRADWITVNTYLGSDGITPFLACVNDRNENSAPTSSTKNNSAVGSRESAIAPGRPAADSPFPIARRGGAFALVHTSNPGGDALQSQKLADGRTIAECVADMVASIGSEYIGERGYSALGAVVGATRPADAAGLRSRMPQQIFLVPGYGAQGGGIEDVLPCFNEHGSGAIITASRSVIFAPPSGNASWQSAVREAGLRMADEVGSAVGMR